MSTKTCSKCGEEKDFSLFYYVKGKPGSWCKACSGAACKRYAKSPDGRAKIRASRSTEEAKKKKATVARAYREAKGEELLAKKRAYYDANKERHAQQMAQNYAANKDAVKARVSAWKSANAAKVTFFIIDFRNPDRRRLSIAYIGFEKYLCVRFFHITIKELSLLKA